MTEALGFFEKTRPFADLPQQLLGEVAQAARPLCFAPGETVAVEPVETVVVESGRVGLFMLGRPIWTLLPGDATGFERFFPLKPGESLAARAEGPVCCFVLPDPVMARVLGDPAAFSFFDARSRSLALVCEPAGNGGLDAASDPFLRLLVRDVTLPPPLFIPETSTLSEAAKRMRAAKVGAGIVGEAKKPLGVLTERDLARALAERGGEAAHAPVVDFMSRTIEYAGAEDTLFEAFGKMVDKNIRRLVAATPLGAVYGLLEERDLLAVKADNPLATAAEIARAADVSDLSKARADMIRLGVKLAAEALPVDRVGRLLGELNDRLVARAVELARAEIPALAQTPLCAVALGGEGRRELYFASDQDNALIFPDGLSPEEIAGIERLGARSSAMLRMAGLPDCPNAVMLENPAWRLSVSGWNAHLTELCRTPDKDAILALSLLADARPFPGADVSLFAGFRDRFFRGLRDNPTTLRYLARETLRFPPPLGLFNRLIVEKSGPDKGTIDLKRAAIFPITQGVKALALDLEIAETATLDRLAGLGDHNLLPQAFVGDLSQAYLFCQELRVKAQVAAVKAGDAPHNRIRPEELSGADRERLKDAFRVVVEFGELVQGRFKLNLLT